MYYNEIGQQYLNIIKQSLTNPQTENRKVPFERLTVGDGSIFMKKCLEKMPRGKGVPSFLSKGSSDSLWIHADAALINLPPMLIFDCSSGEIRRSQPQNVQAYAQYIIGMHDGILLNSRGYVCSSDGLVLVESMRDNSLHDSPAYVDSDLRNEAYLNSLSMSVGRGKYLSGRYLSLVYGLSSNWYHWLVENMGRIPAAYNIPEFESLKIIISPNLSANHLDAIYAMGIKERQLVEYDGNPWICEELYLPSFGAIRASFHPETTLALRRALSRSPEMPKERRKRILISRSDSSIRKVENQKDLSSALGKLGFETLCLGELSFSEQANAFSDASIIVAPHGAGLANLIFAPSGASVIELLPDGPDGILTLYHALASSLEMPYLGVVCPATGVHNDFFVPPDPVVQLVKAFASG